MIEVIGNLSKVYCFQYHRGIIGKLTKSSSSLRKEIWNRKLIDRHGTLIQMNKSVRHFIRQYDVESIINDTEKLKIFQDDLKKVLVNEKL